MKKPTLSIVVIFHNMVREAERTLISLSAEYQTNVSEDDYEIIAIDNGSAHALDPEVVGRWASNSKYYFHKTRSVSPAAAVNFGVKKARGDFVAVIVDGARMASPGLVSKTIEALHVKDNPFVCSLSWHLGPDVQNHSITQGYDQSEEDRLLTKIDWRRNGYKLFDISTIAQSSNVMFGGGMPSECSYFAMRTPQFAALGGLDERFQAPGGGLINQDFLARVLTVPDIDLTVILGEGVFHQYHGGVATNVPMAAHPIRSFQEEYIKIHGERFQRGPIVQPSYFGEMHPAAMRFVCDGFDTCK
jgi:glycosyltransferase involved in cell wall biosynthesis